MLIVQQLCLHVVFVVHVCYDKMIDLSIVRVLRSQGVTSHVTSVHAVSLATHVQTFFEIPWISGCTIHKQYAYLGVVHDGLTVSHVFFVQQKKHKLFNF